MKTTIISVRDAQLRVLVQSFLFFQKENHTPFSYTTFPNTNLCLAIYKQNTVVYTTNATANHCQVSPGIQSTSRLYGFHRRPFTVSVQGPLDQVCILFHPGALRAFTDESIAQLWPVSPVLDHLFPGHSQQLLESMFSTDDLYQRANRLEPFLLQRLLPTPMHPLIKTSLRQVNTGDAVPVVGQLAASYRLNESTLYRLFMDHVGQSPKAYTQTVRFRQSLNTLITTPKESFSQVAYQGLYCDQAHWTKHIKRLTGFTPSQLQRRSQIEQGQLIWVPKPALR
ncbi:helix-turn-helix domain-containing protein [Spirosoma endbachense]|uniref:Helix-turn-helix domain-containing protein n=1 Tax=Spirosoma endbachense TaxID=2666025 RepID=A0A6P1W1N5_9BACT|nr:helix-turn-helix domain-containing protein [Spirosoma endbachense]QHV99323.1 helix-turn-helix domain-containing protein [Spirosoma endbachense]